MNVRERLEIYAASCRLRLRRVVNLRIAAIGLVALGLVTLGYTAIAVYLVPTQGWVWAARALVGLVVVAAAVGVVVHMRTDPRRSARGIELRVPAFDGRLTTWLDALRRRSESLILPFLEAETLAVADDHPPSSVVPSKLMLLPALGVLAAVAGLVWLFAFAPIGWQLASQRMWIANLMEDTNPQVVVEPGNIVIPRGHDVVVKADAKGFVSDDWRVHAAFADGGGWEDAGMVTGLSGAHEFVMVAVTDTVDYYVSAGAMRSERFTIEVADLPKVTAVDLQLTYPEWTRLEPTEQDHGDIRAIEGTQAAVTVTTDLPAIDTLLVLGSETSAFDVEDTVGKGGFPVLAQGTWHVAVMHGGESVRISDEYLIDLLADEAPEIEFVFPGHDRSASPIEEVAMRFSAVDDYGVDNLVVNYAVNGGEWRREDLLPEPTPGVPRDDGGQAPEPTNTQVTAGYTFYLEDVAVAGSEGERSMRPGDVISFFIEAEDHNQSAQSALYFVDAKPFDKRYRDVQSQGGGGGGEGNDMELAARQRDIVSATWNLIRDRGDTELETQALRDQADVIALLQRTLKDQVATLVDRSRSRGLGSDEEVDVFVTELTHASEYMETSAELLNALELDDAVMPEQKALQHLLTAEASVRDVDVSLSQNEDGRGSSSQSLSELIDLEMDTERNRYEVPQSPNFGQEQPSGDNTDWQRLEELARKQQRLEEMRREQPDMQMPKWQLEQLKRELDELRDQLARRAENSRSRPERIDQAIEQLDVARDAIDRSLDPSQSDANQPGGQPGQPQPGASQPGGAQSGSRQAGLSSSEAMRNAAQQIREADSAGLSEQVSSAAERASRLSADQERIVERLDELQRETIDAMRAGEDVPYRNFDMLDDVITKRRMQRDLQQLTSDLDEARVQLGNTNPELARQLERALNRMDDERVSERIAASANAFESGSPLFVISQENRVAGALEQFSDRLGRISQRLEAEATADSGQPTVAEVQSLRQQLQQARQGGDTGSIGRIARTARTLADRIGDSDGRMYLGPDRDEDYVALGTSDANDERLYQLTLSALDDIEVSLRKVDGVSVRSEDPRDDAYDSDSAARYFERLSCGTADC